MRTMVMLVMAGALGGCVPLALGGAVGYAAAPKTPTVVVNNGAAAPAPATSPSGAPTKSDRCERGWYTTARGYCCPLGYDDAGNGTCNPSQALVEASGSAR